MKILFVTTDISWPLKFGGEIRKWNILQGLLQAGHTDAAVFRGSDAPLSGESFAGCKHLVELPSRHYARSETHVRLYGSTIGRGLLALSSSLPFEYRSAGPAELRAILRTKINASDYDLVWFETDRPARLFGDVRGPATVLDGDDFGYVRNLELQRGTPWYGAKIWDYLDVVKLWLWERSCSRRFSFVVRCSEDDRSLHPSSNVVVIPNGTAVPAEILRKPEKRALFVGYLGYPPNSLGMEWFLSEVWPRVQDQVPDACLDIIGQQPPASIRGFGGKKGVVVHDFVEDLTPAYMRAAVSVVPLFAGGGTRLKILESLARGVPVISTVRGAYGIEADEIHGLIRVSLAREFAVKCVALLENMGHVAQTQALAGRELVRGRYDWKVVQRQVSRLAKRAVAAQASQDGRLVSARK